MQNFKLLIVTDWTRKHTNRRIIVPKLYVSFDSVSRYKCQCVHCFIKAPNKFIVQAATTKNMSHQQICQHLISSLDHKFKNVVNLKIIVHRPHPFSCQILSWLEAANCQHLQYKFDI